MSIWLTDLADILRAAGCNVIEETYNRGPYAGKDWKKVGFGGQGLRAFQYILWHHDASPTGDSPGALEWVKYMEIAPAAAAWVCVGCNGQHASGTWHLYASGLSNHAGTGGPWDPNNGSPYVGQDGMNAVSWGIETDHTFGESWKSEKKQAQLASLRTGTAAVLAAYGMPAERVIRHLDWTNGGIDGVSRLSRTYGRKNDIDGLDFMEERRILTDMIRAADGNAAKIEKVRARIRRLRAKIAERRKAGESIAGLPSRIDRLRERLRQLQGK